MLEEELRTIIVTEHKDLILSCEFSEIFLKLTINPPVFFFSGPLNMGREHFPNFAPGVYSAEVSLDDVIKAETDAILAVFSRRKVFTVSFRDLPSTLSYTFEMNNSRSNSKALEIFDGVSICRLPRLYRDVEPR
jgi:hypothetical protein